MTVSAEKLTTGKTVVSADRAITEALKVKGVPKEALATAVGFVRELASKDLRVTNVLTKGTPVWWDAVSLHTQVSPSQLSTILPLLATPGLRGIKTLINGIPDPDVYHLEFDVNIPQ